MEFKYTIDDSKIANMTSDAKERLIKQAEKHTLEIINEAERIEEASRENGAKIEITENTIFQAVRRSKTSSLKKNWMKIVLKILSEVLLFIAGLLFNQDKFATDTIYFLVFTLVFMIALIITIIMHVKDGE